MANVHSIGQCNLRAFPCCKTWDIKITETPYSFIRQEGLRWCVSSLGANHILEAFCQKLPNSPAPFCPSLTVSCLSLDLHSLHLDCLCFPVLLSTTCLSP